MAKKNVKHVLQDLTNESGKKYRLVIFDWDGTLIDSEARIVDSIQYSAKENDFPVLPKDVSKQVIGLSLEKAILGLYPEASSVQVQAMSKSYIHYFLTKSNVKMQPFEGSVDLLDCLKRLGIKLAVATGKSRKGLNQVMQEVAWANYFDITRTPVESASKPNPLMLSQILEVLDIDVSEAIMIGDTEFDLLMANNIGMDSVALTQGVHTLKHLVQFNPKAYANNLLELKKWLFSRV